MISDKLIFYGDRKDAGVIGSFVDKCSEVLALESKDVLVITDEECCVNTDSHSVSVAVVPYESECILSENAEKVSYSVKDSSATVSALNLQRRENCSCFELLYKPYMGRVYIPNGSDYTAKQILISSAVLVALGANVQKIIEVVNEKLGK